MQDNSEKYKKYNIEFVVIESRCNCGFSERVASRLNEGWELKDDIKVTHYSDKYIVYSQAMIRYTAKDK